MSYGYYGFPKYISVADKKHYANQYISSELKKGHPIEPIYADNLDKKIITTWWGKAWVDNLKRYADFENRISRGKSYIKNGFVVDLKIQQGEISGKVQGTHKKPYSVNVTIDPLKQQVVDNILNTCDKRIASIDELVSSKFPEELKDLFFQENGLFPKLSEIHFGCSCPDYASLCKHVIAILYGVGVKLDQNPILFFQLRGIDFNKFIDTSIHNKVEKLVKNSKKESDRIIDDEDVNKLFGI